MTGYAPDPPQRPSWTGERRVTCDLDDARPFDVVRAWHYLKAAGAHELEARVSSSGNGFHVRAWFDDDLVDEAAVERLRYGGGDHPRRVRMDREHHIKPGQVLFSAKWDGEAGEWFDDPWSAVDELLRRTDNHDAIGYQAGDVGWFDE